jgi:hypothetical protein
MDYILQFKDTFGHTYTFLNIILVGFTNDFLNDLKIRSSKMPLKLVL